MDLVGGATIERGVWSVLVIPVSEKFERILECCLASTDNSCQARGGLTRWCAYIFLSIVGFFGP